MSVSKRNEGLASKLAATKSNPKLVAASAIPAYDTVNKQGLPAYKIDKWHRLLSILNTSKVQDQFYRTTSELLTELYELIEQCAKEDALLTAKCIVWSRCISKEGMRTINHVAAAFLAPYTSGREWARRFYSTFYRKEQRGGTIFRPDDVAQIGNVYFHTTGKTMLPNAMRRGFADYLQKIDSHLVLKYKDDILDYINLCHPDPRLIKENGHVVVPKVDYVKRLKELIESTDSVRRKSIYEGHLEKAVTTEAPDIFIPAIEALMIGMSVSADTHGVVQSDAGQLVAKAVKEGKMDENEAAIVLQEAKDSNWASLLKDGKLPIKAALMNLRNILKGNPTKDTVQNLCSLVSNEKAIINGKILPHEIDIANEVIVNEVGDMNAREVSQALMTGYLAALPNLSQLLHGRNLVIVDMSGSMQMNNGRIYYQSGKEMKRSGTFAAQKAALIAATIAKTTNADVILFGDSAKWFNYNPNQDIFTLGNSMMCNMSSTHLASAFRLAKDANRVYDRIFVLSDHECNVGSQKDAYKEYVGKVADPYVYSIDLAGYGTNSLGGPKVRYYFGYGYQMFDDISQVEFNPAHYIEQVRKIVI